MRAKHVMSFVVALIAVLALAGWRRLERVRGARGGCEPGRREEGGGRDARGADRALATYKSGDTKAAEDQVAEAYLQHFEDVEGPLEDKDAELKEKLEDAISERAARRDEGRQARRPRSRRRSARSSPTSRRREAALR